MMTKRAFLLLLLISSCSTAWAQESSFRDFDPDTIGTLYFQYASGSESLSIHSNFDGAAVRMVTDSLGGYEDRMTDVRTKRMLFTVRHEGKGQHAEMLMYYPSGRVRVRARFLDVVADSIPVAFFVPSLRRPLSADALLDGNLTTYHPDGIVRQQSVYQRGTRIKSQCFDFKNRPVSCNDNQLIIPARLPEKVYSQTPFDYKAAVRDSGYRSIKTQALFVIINRQELSQLRLSLSKKSINRESVSIVEKGLMIPINFAVVAQIKGQDFTGSRSGAGNHELRSIALNAGKLFWDGSKQPALIDGEPVTTYFCLPIEFRLR